MDQIPRRATTAAMALLVALVLALGAVAATPGGADARPMAGFGHLEAGGSPMHASGLGSDA